MPIRSGRLAARFRDLPIRQKLIAITIVTMGSALLLAGVGIITADSLLLRGYIERDLTALAQIIADDCTAPLSFDDPRAAAEVLSTLRARQHLRAACLYRSNGDLMASYLRTQSAIRCPAPNHQETLQRRGGFLTLSRPVVLEGRTLGSLTIVYDLDEITEQTKLYALLVLGVFALSSVITLLLSANLRSSIATPVSHLVRATTAVSKTGDYRIRAEKLSGDELGSLVDAFNGMLGSIQARQRELTQALFDRGVALLDAQSTRDELTRLNRDLAQSNEKLARSNDDLERFAFIASHDLQEPLRMITLFSQLLVRTHPEGLGEPGATYIGNIIGSTKRLRDLLADLLAFTEIGAPSDEPAEIVDLNIVLEKARENLKASVEESGAIISAEPLPVLRAYEGHFIPLFQNLVGNAIKYRSELPPRIHIAFHPNGDQLEFAVADNGIGIEPEYHAKIFVAFKRLHGRHIPGTGVGLAICQRLVDRYGGRIWVESRAGAGATFRFTIPAEKLIPSEEM